MIKMLRSAHTTGWHQLLKDSVVYKYMHFCAHRAEEGLRFLGAVVKGICGMLCLLANVGSRI